jgi:phosphatidylserine/phosphatidylglycerophosphate/cardiolipin synthase-like enzyme
MGGAEKLGIHVAPASPRPTLPPELEAIRVGKDEVMALRDTTISRRLQAEQANAAAIAQSVPTSTAEESLIQIPVRSVSVFEHRELLKEALESARRRILLISPWIKSGVVNKEFVARLERRLRAGTVVHIAYGFGKNDSGSDSEALSRLNNLQKRFPARFTFARLANTHAKILIFDDKWISTSFNWLSFSGDPGRAYRMEEGTLVQIPAQVTSAYDRYLAIIETGRIDT